MYRSANSLPVGVLSLRLVVLCILLCAIPACGHVENVAGRRLRPTSKPSESAAQESTLAKFYLGVYEPGENASFRPIASFSHTVGRKPNIVLDYSGWLEPFDSDFAREALTYGSTPLIQIDPTNVDLTSIADGAFDGYLIAYAHAVRAFGHPVILGFAHEMNGPWYSWGKGHTPPSIWIDAWRHVVRTFRSAGATNVIWMWTVNRVVGDIGPVGTWWPGAAYVDLIGIDGYYYSAVSTFGRIYGETIAEVRRLTRKPILLSEIGVGSHTGQAAEILGLFNGIEHYGLLGLVWFDVNQPGGDYHQDWRLEGNRFATAAFRTGLAAVLADRKG